MNDRAERLASAVLYLVCDDQGDAFLDGVLRGGVDILQLRMKDDDDHRVLDTGLRFKRACDRHRALLIVNDRPDLAVELGADGVHIGQDDVSVDEARAAVGEDRLIGLSTHTPAQVDAAASAGVDYIGVGPVHETPTKPGRPAVGLELVRYAADHARLPFFAIGGISAANVRAVRVAGAKRIAVVRAVTEAADPELATLVLHKALDRTEARVGAT